MQMNHVAIALVITLSLVLVYEQAQRSSDSETLHIQMGELEKEIASLKEENTNRFEVLMSKTEDVFEINTNRFEALMSRMGEVLEAAHKSVGVQQEAPPKPCEPVVEQPLPTFKEIGTKYGTDKVSTHTYFTLYDKYLPILRKQKKVKMLEIGLGCDMNYGPGHSLLVWHEYFKNNEREIDFIEFDGECIHNYLANHTIDYTKIFVGSQSDRTFLRDVINQTGGMFDIIIDDGGHTMTQQRVSIEEMLVAVKPGGLYVVEDLQTSAMPYYKDSTPLMADVVAHWVKSLAMNLPFVPSLVTGDADLTKADYVNRIESVECAPEMCVVTKKLR